jgi:CBS domain-containing protein
MQIKEIMTRNVECARPDATLEQAAQRMRDLDVGTLPVCDNDRLAGMLTDRDIAIRAVAEGMDPRSTTVRDVMTSGVTYCFENQDVDEAARLMEEKQVRRIVVLDERKRLAGILSLGDLAVRHGDDRLSGEALEAVSEPVHA